MLKRVFEKYPPDYIAVAFDSSAPTQRHEQYQLYKATRKKMPPISRSRSRTSRNSAKPCGFRARRSRL